MKKVMNCLYVHKSNISELHLDDLGNYAIEILDRKFPNYQVVKYDPKKRVISGIESPDWNTANEPIVGDSMIINLVTGEEKIYKGRKENPQIYHNKWQFVADDYTGFDIEAAKQRTIEWNNIPNLNKSKIGNKNYWVELLKANGMEE